MFYDLAYLKESFLTCSIEFFFLLSLLFVIDYYLDLRRNVCELPVELKIFVAVLMLWILSYIILDQRALLEYHAQIRNIRFLSKYSYFEEFKNQFLKMDEEMEQHSFIFILLERCKDLVIDLAAVHTFLGLFYLFRKQVAKLWLKACPPLCVVSPLTFERRVNSGRWFKRSVRVILILSLSFMVFEGVGLMLFRGWRGARVLERLGTIF